MYACLTSKTKVATHLKMVKGIHFMECVFYHNFKKLKKTMAKGTPDTLN